MNNAQTHLKMGYVWTVVWSPPAVVANGYDWVVIGGAKPFADFRTFIYGPGAVRLGDELSAVGLYFRRINFGMVRRQTPGRKLPLILSALCCSARRPGGRRSPVDSYVCDLPHCGRRPRLVRLPLSARFTLRESVRQKRGRFVAVNQLTIVIGVLAARLSI
ncbi:hypothetical protein MJ584_20485 [Klebsiella pneumoniae]|nr:hypothetical protein MJ584_20485 [Klebsiella pneumoniae]